MAAQRVTSAELRLSAGRAFIGLIRPGYRRIGVKLLRNEIRVSVILADDDDDRLLVDIVEDISVAAAEIVADFPGYHIRKDVAVSSGPLPVAHIIDDGLIYQRWEDEAGQ